MGQRLLKILLMAPPCATRWFAPLITGTHILRSDGFTSHDISCLDSMAVLHRPSHEAGREVAGLTGPCVINETRASAENEWLNPLSSAAGSPQPSFCLHWPWVEAVCAAARGEDQIARGTQPGAVRAAVESAFPGIRSRLDQLVRIPSVSSDAFAVGEVESRQRSRPRGWRSAGSTTCGCSKSTARTRLCSAPRRDRWDLPRSCCTPITMSSPQARRISGPRRPSSRPSAGGVSSVAAPRITRLASPFMRQRCAHGTESRRLVWRSSSKGRRKSPHRTFRNFSTNMNRSSAPMSSCSRIALTGLLASRH